MKEERRDRTLDVLILISTQCHICSWSDSWVVCQTLAASQCGQSEHLLKGECVVFWVLDAQDFGWVQSSPHSIQHRGRVAARHIWRSTTNTEQMGQMDTSMQTQALTTIAAGPFHIFRFLLLPGLKLKHSCIKSRQSDQLMVSRPVCQISLS